MADQLLERISSLHSRAFLNLRDEVDDYLGALYAPLATQDSNAPIEEVLQRVVSISKDKIDELRSTGKRGPQPDAAIKKFISDLAQIFGKENATAGWNYTEDRRVSPFIDFVQTILFALPEYARIGRNGPYTWAAIEEHVHEVCGDLKKVLPARMKKQRLAG